MREVIAYTTGFAALFWAFLSGWWELTPETFQTPVPLGGAIGELELPLWLPLVVTVVAGSFLPFLFSFFALKHLTATAAGVVAASEVIFAFLVAWLWLGESLDAIQLVGAAVVLVGIVLAQTARAGKVVDADLAISSETLAPEKKPR